MSDQELIDELVKRDVLKMRREVVGRIPYRAGTPTKYRHNYYTEWVYEPVQDSP